MTIERVAADLGEDIDFLYDVAMGLDTEDGVIWVYGAGETEMMAFSDFGIDTLIEAIKEHRKLAQSNPET